ncbi:MAG: 2TM domain-containing protein [Saprospiraceae bacterium]|nr:2TM domain-containing protein [Saprospiraceae bacterium]
MGRRNRLNPQARRIRKKRNFLMHLMFYICLSAFFFLINVFTYAESDMWWFVFPVLSYGVVVFIHYIFSIGKNHMEHLAIRWEENEQGQKLGIHSLDELDADDDLDLEELREVRYSERRHFDDDFV